MQILHNAELSPM